ncbi:hypothetical protein KI688_000085 [Linnemannia hyalina]|uniref:Uncharacterized protein n=1 Tax=Linnemannia hyalina TaxID=64524 RepID=A0A9P7Y3K4_9FUNG|nr:hypothetical protein KI688_000085 [Linnemannia hyalina]
MLRQRVAFFVTVKGEPADPFPCKVNPTTVTVEELLLRIRDKEEKDKELQIILKLYLDAKINEITVDVGFSTKGFSSFSMVDVEARVGTQQIDRMRLKVVDCDSGERQEALKILLEVLKFARGSMGNSSEACMIRFAGLFFMMACALFPDLDLVPEKSITGRWGTDQVNYLIEPRNAMDASMVGVVEANKGTTFVSGFPLNVALLGVTLFNRMKLDCRHNGKPVVADASKWEFVECKMKAAAAIGNDHRLVVKGEIPPVTVNYKDDK